MIPGAWGGKRARGETRGTRTWTAHIKKKKIMEGGEPHVMVNRNEQVPESLDSV